MINEHIEIGLVNTLRIDRKMAQGLYLHALDEEDVLLPFKYMKDEMLIGDELEVFVYTDSEDRVVATTQRPIALLGEFGLFEVVDTTSFGAFVDWGLDKDLLVPNSRQKRAFEVGEYKLLKVAKDTQTERLIATQRFQTELMSAHKRVKKYEKVNVLIFDETDLGYKAIVNNRYEGLLFHNEIFENIKVGDKKSSFVKNIRADGMIDLSLTRIGGNSTDENEQKILDMLEKNGGTMPYNYKSEAERIKNVFGLSKKVYKKTLTGLIEAGRIEIDEEGMVLK